MLNLLKDTQNSPSLPPPLYTLGQCCAKSGKTIPGSGGQEWPSKFPINIK